MRNEFEAANERARQMEKSAPKAVSAYYDRKSGHVVVRLNSNLILSF